MAENVELVNVCGICLSQYAEPKILPCFHTFCRECLEKNIHVTSQRERFNCPTCRTAIEIPTGGITGFQTNFYVSTMSTWISDFDCEACGNSKTARHKCKECDQNFCESCSKIHQRMSSSKEHHLIPLLHVSDNNSSCIKHPCEKVTKVCKDCNELVCHVCKETLHTGHSCMDLSVEAQETRQKLRKLINLSEDTLREFENDTRVVKKQADAKHTFFNDQMISLRQQKDALMSKISEIFKSFEVEIKRINDEQKILSNEIVERQKYKATQFRKTIDQSKDMMERAEDTSILKNFDNVTEKLSKINMTLTPVVPGHNLMECVERCTSWLIKLNEQNSKM